MNLSHNLHLYIYNLLFFFFLKDASYENQGESSQLVGKPQMGTVVFSIIINYLFAVVPTLSNLTRHQSSKSGFLFYFLFCFVAIIYGIS